MRKIKIQFQFIFFLLAFCWLSPNTWAQKSYGFEWIRPYQPYFKFKVTQNGLYHIDSSSLAALGNFDPRKIQCFFNGKEQAIFIQGEADGILNANDFVEIYGTKNDGKLDAELFRTEGEQANNYNSLFSDTGVFFITLLPDTSILFPLRMQAYNDNDYSNYLPETSFLLEKIIAPQEEYYYGAFLPAQEKYYISEYGDAEGMMSAFISQGQSRVFTFKTPYAILSQNVSIEIKLIGASDFFIENQNLPNHHTKIYTITNNQNPVLLIDTTYRGYGERKFNRTINGALLGDSTSFLIEELNDLAVGSDFIGLSYIKLNYKASNESIALGDFFGLNAAQFGSKTLLQINNYSNSNPVIWDLKNKKRSIGSKQGNNALALIPADANYRNILIQDLQIVQSVQNLVQVNFAFPNPQLNYSYLIVSNKKLASVAEAYKTYRNQRFNTYLAYSEDLADYFYYGNFHPLAIKRFCEYLYVKQFKKPEYLLLLGRGYQNNLLKSNPENNNLNLVPAMGVPSSDHLFTNGFIGNNGAPCISTGRVPASNLLEANNYLQKLIYFETNADSIQQWRKDFLHVSGGQDIGLQTTFRNKLAGLGSVVKNKPIGANVFAYSKNNSAPSSDQVREKLIAHLNSGVNMMTFYGHGSLTVLDMDFGGITDLQENRRPTFFYFNGCNIGNANDVDPNGSGLVYGKDYICSNGKGAIAWLAHTNLTFTNNLEYQMDQLYAQLAQNAYGATLGSQIKTALELSSQNNEAFARSHALQILLQGDPALVLYSPSKPDYKIAETDLFISPTNASVQNDSLSIGVIIHNLAKAETDSFDIVVTRKLPDNTSISYSIEKQVAPNYQDTFYVWIKPLFKKDIGINTFDVQVNPTHQTNEISYANNEASLSYYIPGSGLQALLPQAYEIISSDSVQLLVQNNNAFAKDESYIFEIDTSLKFNVNSPYYKNSGIVKGNYFAQWNVPITGLDSMAFYWRAKLDLPENQGGVWVTQSFTYVKNGPHGWHQRQFDQIKNSSTNTFISFNDSVKKIEFSNNEFVLGMENRRWDHSRMGVVIPYLLNAGVGNCMSQGTVALVFEPFQVDFPYELPNYPFNCSWVQQNKNDQSVRYYTFNTNTSQGELELKQFIDSVPEGYYVAMFSRYSSGIPNWQASTKTLFSKLGSAQIEHIKSANTAWALIGKKGEAPGQAIEDTVNNNALENAPHLPPYPTDPQDDVFLRIRRNIKLKWFTGSFVSAPIGPAKNFHSLNLALIENDPLPSGKWWLNIIGTNILGSDTILISKITSLSFDLSSIDAKKYPYIKLELGFIDSNYRTPHQVNFWQVIYDPSAELSIDLNSNYSFHANNLEQGDSLKLSLPIVNIGRASIDTTDALIEIIDDNRNKPVSKWMKVPPLNTLQTYVMPIANSSNYLRGSNQIQVNINANKKYPELSYNNNFYKQSFVVKEDDLNPFLEVTFDGYRIMNGDFVSPSPIIKISSTDKNPFLLQKDTSTFELFIRKPKQFDFERVLLNSSELQFIPANETNQAQLIYSPAKLLDGMYSLKVQAIDASGNKAGNNDFEIDFNVLNKSTISHFYPYPNPFTTQTRFVFTLTGEKAPDQVLLRILTVNGKVIREVRKDEFGPIHIGNNVSEFAWDGTDQYGDKLANGVYLYQVFTKIEGQEIETRTTKAKEESSFFLGGTGKLFLMR